MMNEMETTLLIDESNGIHIPKRFHDNFDFARWNLNRDDFADLSNADSETYWETWEDLLRDAKHTDEKGIKWTLMQDERNSTGVAV